MKWFGVILLLLHTVPQAVAQSSTLAGVPACGLTCLLAAVEASSCAITDTPCICNSAPLQVNVSACVVETCTIKESLLVQNATVTLCNRPSRSKSEQYNIISDVTGTISGVFLAVRLLSKWYLHVPYGGDDWAVLAALATGIPSSYIVVHGLTSNGLGKDIWVSTPKQITDFIMFFYTTEVLYFCQVFLLKMSLLFFYMRIFPGSGIKKVMWLTMGVVCLYGVIFVMVAIFQCQPVSYYWTKWDGEHTGRCINVNVLSWANAVISIVLDLWMLGIPVSQLWGLQMHWKKKLSVSFIFMVGTFLTVISIIRLQSLVTFANSTNPTWDNLPVGIWSSIEINVGIMCVCLPNIRMLLVRLFPKILGSSRNNTHPTDYMQNSHSHIGGNISVSRARRGTTNGFPGKDDGIMMEQSFTVDYTSDRHDDELELVEMGKGMGKGGMKASSSETSL